MTGLLTSYILSKTLHSELRPIPVNEEKDKIDTNNYTPVNNDNSYKSEELPPERDLRDPQPTISVNYRIIKDNSENNLEDRNQTSKGNQYQDDWGNNDTEW